MFKKLIFIENFISLELPNHLFCFTDDSGSGSKMGYNCLSNFVSILTSKLIAMYSCLTKSSCYVEPSFSQSYRSASPYTPLLSFNIHFNRVYQSPYINLPEHDTGHHATKESLLFRTIFDPLPTTEYDLKNFHRVTQFPNNPMKTILVL